MARFLEELTPGPDRGSRSPHPGQAIAHRCILAELRADWKCLAEVFGLPHWGAKTGICMRCSASLSTYKDFFGNAPWMLERYGHWDFLLRQKNEARLISSIFRSPFFRTTCFKMDWLHIMDYPLHNRYPKAHGPP